MINLGGLINWSNETEKLVRGKYIYRTTLEHVISFGNDLSFVFSFCSCTELLLTDGKSFFDRPKTTAALVLVAVLLNFPFAIVVILTLIYYAGNFKDGLNAIFNCGG